jgi:hypothetical protein
MAKAGGEPRHRTARQKTGYLLLNTTSKMAHEDIFLRYLGTEAEWFVV